MKYLALLSSILAGCFFGHAHLFEATNQTVPDDVSLSKRWYSVATKESQGSRYPYQSAWPVVCTTPRISQPVYYCFKDKRSAKNLGEILDAAIRIWTPAIAVTSMSIIPDPQCKNPDECICDNSWAKTDSLVISDVTKDGDDKWNNSEECCTETTVGFIYLAPNAPVQPWRHFLKFGGWNEQSQRHQERNLVFAVREMAHELGHALGLRHEHQRQDRDQFLVFQPWNLAGYEKLDEILERDPKNIFDKDMPLRVRKVRLFESGNIAEKYWPILYEFLKRDQFAATPLERALRTAESSVDFDYNSIMIYDSCGGGIGKPDDEKKWVLKRRDDGSPVWQGGSKDGHAKITEGDVAAIAHLYDAKTPQCEAAKTGENDWSPQGMRVKIRDGPWVAVPPPNKSNFTKEASAGLKRVRTKAMAVFPTYDVGLWPVVPISM